MFHTTYSNWIQICGALKFLPLLGVTFCRFFLFFSFSPSSLRTLIPSLFVCVCVCVCVHTYIHAYIRTYIHTCVHTYVHTYIHACIHAYVRPYIHTYRQTDRQSQDKHVFPIFSEENIQNCTFDPTLDLSGLNVRWTSVCPYWGICSFPLYVQWMSV